MSSGPPPDPATSALSDPNATLDLAQSAAGAARQMREAWGRGERLLVEGLLAQVPALRGAPDLLLQLLSQEISLRREREEQPTLEEYAARFPELREGLRGVLGPGGGTLAGGATTYHRPEGQTGDQAGTLDLTLPRPSSAARPRRPGLESAPEIPGYEIVEELGRGGMGVVYLARELALGRLVALKVLLAGPLAGLTERQRFKNEAECIARLVHPHIVAVHATGEHEGNLYLAMEFCAGGSLARRLGGLPLPPREAARVVTALARAVHRAHQANVIHRDLKPANVMLAPEDPDRPPAEEPGSLAGWVVKVADFGLARKLDEAGMTATGTLMGTVAYMPPEQARGNPAEIGPHSDIYALGAILYDLLTGTPPFRGTTLLDTLQQVEQIDPVPPGRLVPSVPADLQTVCMKCLEKEPGKRYRSAAELADDLDRFLAGRPITARPVGPLTKAWKWARRRPAVAALLAGLAAVTLTGAAGVTVLWRRAVAEAHQKEIARQKAEQRLYLNQVLLADRELAAGKPAWARERLANCPEEWRRWEWYALHRLSADPPTAVRRWAGHTRAVSGVAFAPDGQRAASSGGDGTVRLWRVSSGEPLRTFAGHVGSVNGVAFSPDGRTLASAGEDRTVVFRALDGDQAETVYRAHADPVVSIAWHPAGGELASATFSLAPGVIHLHSPGDAAPRRVLEGHAARITALAWHPQGRRLASASHDRSVRLWDPATGDTVRVLRHEREVACVAWHPGGGLLASAGGSLAAEGPEEVEVLLWDAETGEVARRLRGHYRRVTALAFSPDGDRLATAGSDEGGVPVVKVWDVTTGLEVLTLREPTGAVYGLSFSPDGGLLAAGGVDGVVRVWDGRPGP